MEFEYPDNREEVEELPRCLGCEDNLGGPASSHYCRKTKEVVQREQLKTQPCTTSE